MSISVVIIRYRAHPEQVATALAEIQELVATVLDLEPECGGIEIVQDVADPTRITLIEHWPSQEAFEGPHMQQPHIQAFIGRAGEFLTGPPELSFWHSVSRG